MGRTFEYYLQWLVALLFLVPAFMALVQLIRTLRRRTGPNIQKLDRYSVRRANPWQGERTPTLLTAVLNSVVFILGVGGIGLYVLYTVLNR